MANNTKEVEKKETDKKKALDTALALMKSLS